MSETVTICGLTVPVRFGTEKDQSELSDSYACYDRDTCTIWVHTATPADKVEFWKVHEALHALCENSGVIYATAAIFGVKRDDSKVEAWEEAVIRILCPHILQTFGPARGNE